MSLRSVGLTDEQRMLSDHIIRGVEQMQRLIHDLLAYTKLEAYRRKRVPISIADAHDEVIGLLRSDIATAGATVICTSTDTVLCDQGGTVVRSCRT